MVEQNDGAAEARARIAALIPEERRLLVRECAVGMVTVAIHLIISALCLWTIWLLWTLRWDPTNPPTWRFLIIPGSIFLAANSLVCVIPFFLRPRPIPMAFVEVDALHHPELFRLVQEVAARLKIRPPVSIRLTSRTADVVSCPQCAPATLLRHSDQCLWIGAGSLSSVTVSELRALIGQTLLWWDAGRDDPNARLFSYWLALRLALSGHEYGEGSWYLKVSERQEHVNSLVAWLVWCAYPMVRVRNSLVWAFAYVMGTANLRWERDELLLSLHFGSNTTLSAFCGEKAAEATLVKMMAVMAFAGTRGIFTPELFTTFEAAAARNKLAIANEPPPPAWETVEVPTWIR